MDQKGQCCDHLKFNVRLKPLSHQPLTLAFMFVISISGEKVKRSDDNMSQQSRILHQKGKKIYKYMEETKYLRRK